jgi:zinc protease
VLQLAEEPRSLANNAFAWALYGGAHPWGPPLLGTRRTLAALTRADAVAFHHERYHAGNAVVLAAGDVTEDELRSLLEPRLGGWERRAAPAPVAPAPPREEPAAIHIVDRPGAAQSEIRVGRIAAERSTPDYFPLIVLNTVLGGSFTSRLNAVLREEKGFTYGAHSGFATRKRPGPFTAQAAVHTPATAEAAMVFLNEIEKMREEEVPPAELERARSYVALRLPQRFETPGDLIARLSEQALYGLPDDYWSRYVPELMAVDGTRVLAAARRHLDPRGMAVVVSGDRAAIEGPLRALGLPVHVLPTEVD